MTTAPQPPSWLDLAAHLLWSWLTQARRKWALEEDCLAALQRFAFVDDELRVTPRKLTHEEARAAFTIAVAKNLIAIDDDLAHVFYANSLGYQPADDARVVRARTSNEP